MRTLSWKIAVPIAMAILATPHALSFKTFRYAGGAIHEEITRAAIVDNGPKISKESFEQIDQGNTGQDIPTAPEFLQGSHHFDDCKFNESLKYVEDCYAAMKPHICKANFRVKDWSIVLKKFGELLHPVQDFYSHSNYAEILLKANNKLLPQQLPLVNWQSISPAVQTGFFYYKGATDNELVMGWNPITAANPDRDTITPALVQSGSLRKGTKYATTAEYSKVKTFNDRLAYVTNATYSVLHRDINKDNGSSEEGSISNPSTKTTLFSYAQNLAVRETLRQWQRLENQVRKDCPKKADSIIKALKEGPTGQFRLKERQVKESGNSKFCVLNVSDDKLIWTNTGTKEGALFSYEFDAPEFFSVGDELDFKARLTGNQSESPLISFLAQGSFWVKRIKPINMSLNTYAHLPCVQECKQTYEIIDGKQGLSDYLKANPDKASQLPPGAENLPIVFQMTCSGGAGDRNVEIKWIYEPYRRPVPKPATKPK